MKFFTTLLCSLFAISNLFAQTFIPIENPSLEGKTGFQRLAQPWRNCSRLADTPIATFPFEIEDNQVFLAPLEGENFVGLTLFDDGNAGGISIALEEPLRKSGCYEITVQLAKSEQLSVQLADHLERFDYNEPAQLLVTGGNRACETLETFGYSEPIEFEEWLPYTFFIQPRQTLYFINFLADYLEPDDYYLGHVMLDAISDVYTIRCDEMPTEYRTDTEDLMTVEIPVAEEERSTAREVDYMPWQGEDIRYQQMTQRSLKEFEIVVTEEDNLNYYQLLHDAYGYRHLVLIAEGRNLNRAGILARAIKNSLAEWNYPEIAFTVKKRVQK